MKNNNKENIILMNGSLYLFWTMGLYYTWELSTKFNLILIVNKEYQKSSSFKMICNQLKIKDLFYVENHKKCSIKSHKYLISTLIIKNN